MDVNEFNPEFNQSVYSASVNEKDVIGTSVVTVIDCNTVAYRIWDVLLILSCPTWSVDFLVFLWFIIFVSFQTFQVFASDKDGDFNLVTYSIVSGNSHGNFSINNSTGRITIAKPLDRELHHQVILTVRGEDSKCWMVTVDIV